MLAWAVTDNLKATIEFRILLDETRDSPFGILAHGEDFFRGQDDVPEHTPPLFSHEAVGMYDLGEDEQVSDMNGESHHEPVSPDEELDPDKVDINDPSLERFPSNREEIIDTVRKLETGLNEDQASFEGAPLSPVIGSSRRGTEDFTADFLLSPLPVSPVVPRAARHLGVPRSPRGSISSAHSSTQSLQAIDEADEPSPAEETRNPPVILLSNPRKPPWRRSPDSDEDEGIAMRDNTSKKTSNPEDGDLLSPMPVVSQLLHKPLKGLSEAGTNVLGPGDSKLEPPAGDQSLPQTPPGIESEAPRRESPRIVIEAAEDRGETSGTQNCQDANGNIEAGSSKVSDGVVDGAASKGVDSPDSNSKQLRKRSAQNEAVSTGTPLSSASIPPDQEGGWFRAFFRMVFVDWIGSFISRLCGGRRKT